MISKTFSASVYGIDGHLIDVEIDIAPGLPSLAIVGLPDASVRESRDRVVSAIRNSGYDFPVRKITVNLAPADLKKEGSAFDLPIAIGILAAAEELPDTHLRQCCLVGELALDGQLRPVRGLLPIAMEVQASGLKTLILPQSNMEEALVVENLRVYGARSLKEVADFMRDEHGPDKATPARRTFAANDEKTDLDFCEVKGQRYAKRALEVASAGGHNVLMIGTPGSGKTMLSKRISSILPPLTFDEAIETTKIHSVAGLTLSRQSLLAARPFRNPHHTISNIALIGGGRNPRPGEVSLAHNGVLFLDELPEFHRDVLEVLRQPLESREVMIARVKETLTFPSSFMLVAAMNPCKCSFRGHASRDCTCTPREIQKYMAKISGPLLDRIDIHLEVPALKLDEITSDGEMEETSAAIRDRVIEAREIQKERFGGNTVPSNGKHMKIYTNSQMGARQVKKFCGLEPEGKELLRTAFEKLGLSARAYDRILKVSRTIADLSGSGKIKTPHLAEAIQYRSLDRVHAPSKINFQ